jgi:RecA-family ATPase
MLEPHKAWPAVKELVSERHLARADHRLIFHAIAEIMNAGGVADGVIVIDRLQQDKQLEAAGGREYIADLVEGTPSAANVAAYARVVRDFADRTKVVDLASEIAARARLGSAAEVLEHAQRSLAEIDLGAAALPLEAEPASAWAEHPPPPPREWVLESLIPAGRVTSLFGNGGLGKTLLALQIGLHVSLGRPLFGIEVSGGPVLGIFCEDEQAELNRRVRAACAAERVELAEIDRLYVLSRDGADSVLCTFDHDHIRLTAFYAQLKATVAALKPHLLILDTAADLFAGDFMSTPHVRQFLKIALNGLCVRHGCAVLLLAHPSAAAISSGEGGGFSTAWSNSVRSRLYLSRPKPPDGDADDPADIQDRRVLEVKKANYAAGDVKLPLLYQSGSFVLDQEPIAGTVGPSAPRTKTARLALAMLDYIRRKNPLAVTFREIFVELQTSGIIAAGDYDELRKPLQRAVRQLLSDGTIVETRIPRGYRLNPELR